MIFEQPRVNSNCCQLCICENKYMTLREKPVNEIIISNTLLNVIGRDKCFGFVDKPGTTGSKYDALWQINIGKGE